MEDGWRKSAFSETANCIEANVWRKSTFSVAGNCIETGSWRKTTYSEPGTCVEIGAGTTVGVRDTKEKHLGERRTILEFSPDVWHAFTASLK